MLHIFGRSILRKIPNQTPSGRKVEVKRPLSPQKKRAGSSDRLRYHRQNVFEAAARLFVGHEFFFQPADFRDPLIGAERVDAVIPGVLHQQGPAAVRDPDAMGDIQVR